MKRIISMLIVTVLVLAIMCPLCYEASAASYYYEVGFLRNNLDYLQDFIERNGGENGEGNMVIQETMESPDDIVIIASESDGLHFYAMEYIEEYDISIYFEMTYKQNVRYAYVYIEERIKDVSYDGEVELDVLNYNPNEDVGFTILHDTSVFTRAKINEYFNSSMDHSIYKIHRILAKQVDMRESELGFANSCNDHSQTIPWYLQEPTCSESGKVEYICKYCGRILDTVTAPATGKHTYVSTVMPATTTNNGKVKTECSVCGDVKKTTTIYKIDTVKLDKTSFTYDGTTKKPNVVVKDSKGKVVSSKYYTVKYPKGCAEIGTYKVTVTFKGNYSGKATCTFKIIPGRATDLKAVSKKAGLVKLTWSEIDDAQKYVIYCSQNGTSGFKKIASTQKTAYNVKDLTSGKTYYFYVKAYSKVAGTSYFGAKSNVANAKVK